MPFAVVAQSLGLDEQSHTDDYGALGVVHIPKTGGLAIRHALAGIPGVYSGPSYFDDAMVGPIEVDQLPDGVRSQFVTSEGLGSVCRTHKLVIGHYGAQGLLDAGCVRLAVLVREPRARLLSLYRFWEAATDDARRSWGEWGMNVLSAAVTMSLEEFLASGRAWAATENAMARQLLVQGTPESAQESRRLTRRALERGPGYGRVRGSVTVADWSQNSQRFADRIAAAAPVAEGRALDRINETMVKGDEQLIGPTCAALLREHTDLDSKVLERLMADRLLPFRSAEDLQAEYEESVRNLGFTLE